VDIVLTGLGLDQPGGVQTYMLAVAPQLERLGHGVTLYAPKLGAMSEVARSRGLRVARNPHELPDDCHAVIASDAVTLLTMADRYPTSIRIIVVHSAELDLHLPPGFEGVASCAVAMNDAVERRLRAMPNLAEVRRLSQPIDTDRYRMTGLGSSQPNRVLMLGNYLTGSFKDDLVRVCVDAGLEWHQVGRYGEVLSDAVGAIRESDIVIGQGRSVLDAMACGRAAWVYGPIAGDGWVTEANYRLLEADGFRGRATDALVDATTFQVGLKEYDPEMGQVNRKLITLHHSAYEHAISLIEIINERDPGRRVDAPLQEVARILRTLFEAQAATEMLTRECRSVNERLSIATHSLAQLQLEHDHLTEKNARLQHEYQLMSGSRRWKLTSKALTPLQFVRQLRGDR